jgi:hypothetical protein
MRINHYDVHEVTTCDDLFPYVAYVYALFTKIVRIFQERNHGAIWEKVVTGRHLVTFVPDTKGILYSMSLSKYSYVTHSVGGAL